MKEQRPWGSYTVLNKGQGFKAKIVEVLPGKKLSLQKHKQRSEHWVVVEGKAKITLGDETKYLLENESTYIPKESIHRLENTQEEVLKIVEIQCGEYLEEDDIERFEDDYGRERSDTVACDKKIRREQ